MTFGIFLTEFREYLESAGISGSNIIIIGDFNYHVKKPEDRDAQLFLELLQDFVLSQCVKRPTHISGNTLDLFIVRSSDALTLVDPIDDYYISDHSFFTTTLTLD